MVDVNTPDWAADTSSEQDTAPVAPNWAVDSSSTPDWAQDTTSVTPSRPGFLSRVATDLKNRNTQVQNAEAQFEVGPSSLATGVGKGVFGSVNDIISEGVKSGYESLPDSIRQPISKGVSTAENYLANTDAGKYVTDKAKNIGNTYSDLAAKYPKTANAVESGADVVSGMANLLPLAKGVSGVGDTLTTFGKALPETAAGEGFTPVASQFTKGQLKAHDILSQALQSEGLKPEDIASRLEDAKQTGLPLTALDVATQNVGGVQTQGRNLLGLADAAANMPGEGAVKAGDIASRGYLAKARIGDAFDKFISSGKSYDVSDDALQRIATEAAPAYEKAFAAAPVTSDRMEQFLKDPDIQKGISRGMHIQRLEALAEGRPFDPNDYQVSGFTEPELAKVPYGHPAPQPEPPQPILKGTPNMRLLDAGKQGLDAMIGDETNDLTGRMTSMGRALTKLKGSYVGELDNLNPDYAAARSAYGSQASRLQALKDGMSFQSMQPEEIKRYMADPSNSLSDQMAFSVGARQKLQDIMGQVGDNANAITRLWKDNIRDRLQPMFGDQGAFEQFSNLMDHEQNMARVNGVLTRGSQTMPRQQYADVIQGQQPNIVGRAVRAITNPHMAALSEGSDFLSGILKKQAANMSNDTAAEIMRHLGSNDPELWRQFSLYKPKNTGGPVFKRGGTIKKPHAGVVWPRPKTYPALEAMRKR